MGKSKFKKLIPKENSYPSEVNLELIDKEVSLMQQHMWRHRFILLIIISIRQFPLLGLMNEGKEENLSEEESRDKSGPWRLNSVDWELLDHRRTIAASLIQGVYILELNRQYGCHQGPEPPAPTWWEFFHFRLLEILRDDADSSIFGAIFENKQSLKNSTQMQKVPRYVVALRGTVLKRKTWLRDLQIDFQLIFSRVSWDSRYKRVSTAIQNIVASAGHKSIWLVGHSQGAAIALLAGREMAKQGRYIDTYLFNPPYPSLPVEKIKDEIVRKGIRITKNIITAGFTFAMKRHGAEKDPTEELECFIRLCSWTPYLFIHPMDPISLEYIGYFEHKEKMNVMGLERIERMATENSFTSLISGVFGVDAEATHLIPSAHVVKNKFPMDDFNEYHGIPQWWKPLSFWESKLGALFSISSSWYDWCTKVQE